MKIEHSIGGHDDSLFAYLIGRYILAYGKNLNKFVMPINGKDIETRHNAISRMNVELNKLNNPFRTQYNGVASDIMQSEINKQLQEASKTRSRYAIFNKLANIDKLESNDNLNSTDLEDFMSRYNQKKKYNE